MSPLAASLAELLRTELDLTRQLETVLERERAAIAGRDAAALEGIVEDKQRLVQRLAHLAGEREARLVAAGHARDRDGLHSFLAAHDAGGELRALWSQVEAAARACREKNRVNGGLLDLSLQAVRQALGLLRGEDEPPAVYGPRGRAPAAVGRRSLAKA